MKRAKNIGIYLIIFGLVLGMVWFYNSDAPEEEKEIKTSELVKELKDENVKNLNITDTKLTAKLKNGDTVYAYINSTVDLQFLYEKYITGH